MRLNSLLLIIKANLLKGIIALISIAWLCPIQAASNFISPYAATYSSTWKKGIHIKIEGTQELVHQADDTWLFSFKAETFFASVNESSLFKIIDNRIQPLRYNYYSSAFGKKKKAELTFNWDKKQVINDVDNIPWKMAIEPGTVDKLSIQLQVRQDVINHKDKLEYQIADGGYVKTWHFKKLNTETIETKYGPIKALKIMRVDEDGKRDKTVFWFAEQFDYLLVKLEHKDGKESYLLELEELKK